LVVDLGSTKGVFMASITPYNTMQKTIKNGKKSLETNNMQNFLILSSFKNIPIDLL
jgi:hypothetical protein